MSAIFSGTVLGWPIGQTADGNPLYDFHTPTPEEIVEINKTIEENRERNKELNERWENERNEREAKWKQERALWLEEARKFPVDGMSGEFDDAAMEVWRTNDADEWPDKLKFVKGKCDFCEAETIVLEVANAADEYPYQSACRGCLGKMFYAFEMHESVSK